MIFIFYLTIWLVEYLSGSLVKLRGMNGDGWFTFWWLWSCEMGILHFGFWIFEVFRGNGLVLIVGLICVCQYCGVLLTLDSAIN